MDATAEARLAMVQKWGVKYAIDPALICAVCEQESAWNTYAVRPEPAFKVKYVDPQNLSVLESWTRSMSWGLMQVMGQVAREHGFTNQFLSELTEPECGLDIGCSVLQSKLKRAGGDVPAGLQFYNGGSNGAYASQVMARMPKYQD